MPQSKKVKNEQTKLRMQKMRNKGVTNQGVTDEGVTEYPAIIHALVDPIKREKLERVYHSLKDFKQEKNVYYGSPYNGISFDVVGELLEATR